MKEPQTIVLERPWGGHSAGAELRVLGPGDEIRPGVVDRLRARTLLEFGIAVDVALAARIQDELASDATAPAETGKPRSRGKKARG